MPVQKNEEEKISEKATISPKEEVASKKEAGKKKKIEEKKDFSPENLTEKVSKKKEEAKEKKKIEKEREKVGLPEASQQKKEVLEEKSVEVKLAQTVLDEEKESPSFLERIKEKFRGKKKEEITEEKKDFRENEIPAEENFPEKKTDQEKTSFFGKVKQTLTTKTISEEKFEGLFWELELGLLENNVSVNVIEKIKVDLKEELVEKPLPWNVERKIEETLRATLSTILSQEPIDLLNKINGKKPYIIAFFGVNGAGKTTSMAKLAYYLQQHHHSVVLAAGDTFRAAAIQQLQEHADRLSVPLIKQNYGADAAAVAYDAVRYAEKNKLDVVLIDTAGRLHSNTNLMAELEKIIRVAKPDLKIFVGESITGNDCIEQAEKFNQLVEMDGVILTKADVDEKGGAPLSISYVIKKPILFLGVGQRYKDFEQFDKEKMLERLGI